MPVKLIVLVVLMGANAALNFVLGQYITGGLGVLILLGVLAGNEGVRKALIVLNILALGVSVVISGFAMMAGGLFLGPALFTLLSLFFGFAVPAYAIWCLTRSDVQHWMFKRSLKGAVD